jgi:hypothetical protein
LAITLRIATSRTTPWVMLRSRWATERMVR